MCAGWNSKMMQRRLIMKRGRKTAANTKPKKTPYELAPVKPLVKKVVETKAKRTLYMRAKETAMRKLRVACPARWWVPNMAQERMFKLFAKRPFPSDAVFMAGNGVGKSVGAVLFALGIIWGPDEVCSMSIDEHPDLKYFQNLELFHAFRDRCAEARRPISVRLIVNPGSMKPNGAMYQRIRAWFPRGLYEMQKLGTTYYSQILCWECEEDVGQEEKILAVIDIKSHDQDVVAHSGSDIDVVIFDEPCPEEIYDEAVARGRGNPDSFRAFFLTPLELSGWLVDRLIDRADGHRIVYCQGSLWDNCIDWHPDPTKRGKTRGHITRAKIEEQIDAWKHSSPEMLEARLNGTPTHLSGALFKQFNPEIHVKREHFTVPNDWPIWFIVDPHHARAPAVAWFAQGPMMNYCIGEWPNEDYVRMDPKPVQISRLMEIIRAKEGELSRQVTQRWGDPNSLKFPYPNSNMTIQQEYFNEGLRVMLADDNLDVGHSKVQELLSVTKDFPIPRFQVFEYDALTGEPMINVPMALSRYGYKKNLRGAKSPTSLMDQTYKDFADVVRYFAVMADTIPYSRVASQNQHVANIIGSRQYLNRA